MRILALLAALPLAACSFHGDESGTGTGTVGSGSGSTRTFSIADFTGVALRGSDDVDVRVGSGFTVRAEGPSAELDKLRIERDGDTLKIGRKDGSGFNWGGHHDPVKVFVTMPRVVSAEIAGSGDMTIDHVDGQAFDGSGAGSGSLTIASLTARKTKFSIAGSGDMKLSGAVDTLRVDIAGSGNVDAGGLKASGASVSVAGSGGVRADVTGAATVSVVGSGDVDLGKGAKCSTSKMGSGEVRCGS